MLHKFCNLNLRDAENSARQHHKLKYSFLSLPDDKLENMFEPGDHYALYFAAEYFL
jgi:hypothetical protein